MTVVPCSPQGGGSWMSSKLSQLSNVNANFTKFENTCMPFKNNLRVKCKTETA